MFAKKNLVAAAALMAIAGAAQADVKLYGYLDAGFGSVEAAHAKGTPTRTTQVTSGGMMTSFIGFAGSEDLGSGMKAEFALESFIGNDTGAYVPNNAGNFWGRTSNVALSGNFGKVALGQYDNPLFTSAYTYNPFGSSMTLSPTMRHLNYIGQTGPSQTGSTLSGAGVGFDTGWVNSVTYESPSVQGFSAVAQYAAKESTAPGSGNNYALSGSYNNGPISATLTYVKANPVPQMAATGPLQTYTANEKVTDLGVSYDFGVVKAFGQYTHIKDDTNNNKDTIYQLGVTVPLNDKVNVMASFGSLKNTRNGASSSVTDRVMTVGADYALSKRTGVYGAFMDNTQTNLSSGQTALFGIKHTF